MINKKAIHSSWHKIIRKAMEQLDTDYLSLLNQNANWLPGPEKVFNAFSYPLDDIRYILFGESPYPRQASANGFAFWDAAVQELWSDTGLSKSVNRATSLRNFIKMLLVADNSLKAVTSQEAIAAVNKSQYITTIDQLFKNLLAHGFLLLNASLVLSDRPVKQDAKLWLPFIRSILEQLAQTNPQIKLLLFGNIAKSINTIAPPSFDRIIAEHPYNLSFIHNPIILDFFRPLKLLKN